MSRESCFIAPVGYFRRLTLTVVITRLAVLHIIIQLCATTLGVWIWNDGMEWWNGLDWNGGMGPLAIDACAL